LHYPLRQLAIMLLLLAGCSQRVTLSGTVTYDGEPVKDGHISFIPVAGQGSTVGAPIKDGSYELTAPPPGKYRVEITGNREVDWPADLPAERKATPKTLANDLIPPGAPGNNQVVEIGTTSQTLNWEVKRPAKK
jgi:hypothetical protein